MDYRRTAFVTCILALSGLGISGALAEGCGGDDTAAPATTGGTAGAGGAGGTAGSGGSSAGSGGRADSGSVDARPDVDYKAICNGGADSGSACFNGCLCDNCAMQTVICFADPPCRRLVDCANAHGCIDTSCALRECPTELAEAGTNGVIEATAVGTCVTGAMCNAKCADGGEGGSDAPATSDAPPTGDAPAVDTGTGAETGAETGAD